MTAPHVNKATETKARYYKRICTKMYWTNKSPYVNKAYVEHQRHKDRYAEEHQLQQEPVQDKAYVGHQQCKDQDAEEHQLQQACVDKAYVGHQRCKTKMSKA